MGFLNHITNWNDLKVGVIKEFGSINIFGREVNQLFDILPCYESVQEVTKDLAPKIKTLQSNLQTMSQFHKQEHFTASPPPVSGPKQHEEPPTGGEAVLQDQFTMFREQDPDNNLATFSFLDMFVNKLKQNYQSNPSLYDLNYGPSSMGVKVVRQGTSNSKTQPPSPPNTPRTHPLQPCAIFTAKGFEAGQFSLGRYCGTSKLSSPDILKIISENHLCPSCTQAHDINYKCKLTFQKQNVQSMSQGLHAEWIPCSQESLHAQKPGPLHHDLQGQH